MQRIEQLNSRSLAYVHGNNNADPEPAMVPAMP